MMNAKSNPKVYGPLIISFITAGYSLASIFYWLGGKNYAEHVKKENKREKVIE
jgi:hypothetical protein